MVTPNTHAQTCTHCGATDPGARRQPVMKACTVWSVSQPTREARRYANAHPGARAPGMGHVQATDTWVKSISKDCDVSRAKIGYQPPWAVKKQDPTPPPPPTQQQTPGTPSRCQVHLQLLRPGCKCSARETAAATHPQQGRTDAAQSTAACICIPAQAGRKSRGKQEASERLNSSQQHLLMQAACLPAHDPLASSSRSAVAVRAGSVAALFWFFAPMRALPCGPRGVHLPRSAACMLLKHAEHLPARLAPQQHAPPLLHQWPGQQRMRATAPDRSAAACRHLCSGTRGCVRPCVPATRSP